MAATIQPELIPANDPNWKKEDALQVQAITPMTLIQHALDKGHNVADLKDLFEMAKEWRRLDAEAAFNRDFSEFKKHKPEILKNKVGKMQGQAKGSGKEYSFEYGYADLFEVADKVSDRLADFGIAHTYESESKYIPAGQAVIERIKVTCILKHRDGHTHHGSTLEGPPDKSGAKNEIQAILSGSSYLERKTLLMTTGCAPKDLDADGGGANGSGGMMDDIQEKLEWIANSGTYQELEVQFREAYKKAKGLQDERAMMAIVRAKDARKKELKEQG